jgi:invasion protein IalB
VKRVLSIATILVAATVVIGAAAAKQAVPPAPSSTAAATAGKPEVSYYGDWAVRCFPVKSVSPCDMLFATVRKNTTMRVTSVSIAYVPSKNSYMMQIAVPLGIDLAQGVVVAAGQYNSGKLLVRRCDRSGCFVEMAASPDLIQGLESNSDQGGQLKVVAEGGKPLSLAMSLKGFAQARQAMMSGARAKAVATP